MKIKAIQTEYKGYLFRSRLEARWAVFFDACGVEYEYEPEGYDLGEAGWYLPDFWLPIKDECQEYYPNAGYFVEIKATNPTKEEIEKVRILSETKHNCLLYYGDVGIYMEGWLKFRQGEMIANCKNGPFDEYKAPWDTWAELHFIALGNSTSSPISKPKKEIRASNKARQARFEHGETPSFADF